MKDLSYEQITQLIRDLPRTWYPALILEMINAAYAKKVFVRGGAEVLVSNHEKRRNRESL